MRRLLLLLVLMAAPLHAQTAGKTGAQVLQFNPGARAGAFAGAYTSGHDDADAIFYNPAGLAGGRASASVAYEMHADEIVFGSAAGYAKLHKLSIGLGIAYLNAGNVAEVVPNPDFDGNTGTATGKSVGASESAARLSIAAPLDGGHLRIGVAAGFVSTAVAEASENAPLADVGAQFDVGTLTIGAGLRNLGGSLSGSTHAPLPTEARLGASMPFALTRSVGATVYADAIARVRESSFNFAVGAEVGLLPASNGGIGAVARVGFDAESNQLAHLRVGAGISMHDVALDYTFQGSAFMGAVHRFGLRWTRS